VLDVQSWGDLQAAICGALSQNFLPELSAGTFSQNYELETLGQKLWVKNVSALNWCLIFGEPRGSSPSPIANDSGRVFGLGRNANRQTRIFGR
jgi:hypothetical protein